MAVRPRRTALLLLAGVAWIAALVPESAAHAAPREISGQVFTRRGEPLSQVTIRMQPGEVEQVTDRHGSFTITDLRDAGGAPMKLMRRTRYILSASRTGFSTVQLEVDYRRGALGRVYITLLTEQELLLPDPWGVYVPAPGEPDVEPY